MSRDNRISVTSPSITLLTPDRLVNNAKTIESETAVLTSPPTTPYKQVRTSATFSPKSVRSSLAGLGSFKRHPKRTGLGKIFPQDSSTNSPDHLTDTDCSPQSKLTDLEKRKTVASAFGSLRGLSRSKKTPRLEQPPSPTPRVVLPELAESTQPSLPIDIPAPSLPLDLIPVSSSMLTSADADITTQLMALTDPSNLPDHPTAFAVQLPERMNSVQWKDHQTRHPIRHAREASLGVVDDFGYLVEDLPTPMPGTNLPMELNPWDGSGAVFERGVGSFDGSSEKQARLGIRGMRSLDALAAACAKDLPVDGASGSSSIYGDRVRLMASCRVVVRADGSKSRSNRLKDKTLM